MAVKKSDLYASLWASCDELRRGMDASHYTFEMLIPPTKDEQTTIAEVLTDMDAELMVLERRREKTRDLKQAMMQELLAGRTRLL